MTSEETNDDADGTLVATVTADPLKLGFGAAILALMETLGDCPAREFAVRELLEAEIRTRLALRRRILN